MYLRLYKYVSFILICQGGILISLASGEGEMGREGEKELTN
jgi:hypothetical protein